MESRRGSQHFGKVWFGAGIIAIACGGKALDDDGPGHDGPTSAQAGTGGSTAGGSTSSGSGGSYNGGTGPALVGDLAGWGGWGDGDDCPETEELQKVTWACPGSFGDYESFAGAPGVGGAPAEPRTTGGEGGVAGFGGQVSHATPLSCDPIDESYFEEDYCDGFYCNYRSVVIGEECCVRIEHWQVYCWE